MPTKHILLLLDDKAGLQMQYDAEALLVVRCTQNRDACSPASHVDPSILMGTACRQNAMECCGGHGHADRTLDPGTAPQNAAAAHRRAPQMGRQRPGMLFCDFQASLLLVIELAYLWLEM